MKILYIITQADGGGAQKYTLTLAKHFNGSIAAGSESSLLLNQAQDLGLEVFSLTNLKRNIHPARDFMAIWEIRQLIKNYEPDIVHLNSTKAGILGSFAAIGMKTKVIFTAHGFIFNEPLPWALKSFYLALEKVASSYRDFIITVSNADKESALGNNLISKDKIQTIHNGIPQIHYLSKVEARQILGLPQDKKIVGCVANDYKTKGLDILKQASSEKYLTVILGKTSKSNPQNKNVKNIGFVHNANKYLKAFDVLTIPSRKEGLPFVLLEAMQAGLPIVATKVGGIPEALGDAGILIEPENPDALKIALEKITSDEVTSRHLSEKTLERSKQFTEEKMLEETYLVYKKVSQ